MKKLILFFLLCTSLSAEILYFNNGKAVEGKILEANATHALIQRSTDLQLFRLSIDLFDRR